ESSRPPSSPRSTPAPECPSPHGQTNQGSSSPPARPSAHTSASLQPQPLSRSSAPAHSHAESHSHRSGTSPQCAANPPPSEESPSDQIERVTGNPSPTPVLPAPHESPHSAAHPHPS